MRGFFLIALAVLASGQTGSGDRVITSDSEVLTVSFSVDGKTLVGTCRDGKVRLWDAHSGKLRRTAPLEKGDAGLTVMTPADVMATVGEEGSVKIWDVETGTMQRRISGQAQKPRRLALSADRKLVAGSSRTGKDGSEETVHVWDASGSQRFAVPAGIGGTSGMAFSPDGSLLAASSYDTNLRAWSARNGELLRLIEEMPVAMFALVFSPDGKYLATAGVDRTVYLWDTKSWKLTRKLTGQEEMIQSMAFSTDGRMLATGGYSVIAVKTPVKVILWDVASGKMTRSWQAPQAVRSVAFSPDGMTLAAASSEKSVQLWAASK